MDTLLLFLQQQGILIVMGMMLVGGLLHQITARHRYRKLYAGIQALSPAQKTAEKMPSEPVPVPAPSPLKQKVFPAEREQEMDAPLTYLRQSLDRIAAGRDQKLEEEPRERRKLTAEQEAVIVDILREYLS